MSERAARFFVPVAVYYTDDGGEWLVRKMSDGFHVIGPYTAGGLGCWPSEAMAKTKLAERAGAGRWET